MKNETSKLLVFITSLFIIMLFGFNHVVYASPISGGVIKKAQTQTDEDKERNFGTALLESGEYSGVELYNSVTNANMKAIGTEKVLDGAAVLQYQHFLETGNMGQIEDFVGESANLLQKTPQGEEDFYKKSIAENEADKKNILALKTIIYKNYDEGKKIVEEARDFEKEAIEKLGLQDLNPSLVDKLVKSKTTKPAIDNMDSGNKEYIIYSDNIKFAHQLEATKIGNEFIQYIGSDTKDWVTVLEYNNVKTEDDLSELLDSIEVKRNEIDKNIFNIIIY